MVEHEGMAVLTDCRAFKMAPVDELPEWQKHVVGQSGKAVCGAPLHSMMWAFTDFGHAEAAIRNEDRLQPCPRCVAAALAGALEAALEKASGTRAEDIDLPEGYTVSHRQVTLDDEPEFVSYREKLDEHMRALVASGTPEATEELAQILDGLEETTATERLREAREAANEILAPICAAAGRMLDEAPGEDAIADLHMEGVVIPYAAFKRLYDATAEDE